jgi:hypothetical protein
MRCDFLPGADGILTIPSVPRSVKNPRPGTVSVLVAAKDYRPSLLPLRPTATSLFRDRETFEFTSVLHRPPEVRNTGHHPGT